MTTSTHFKILNSLQSQCRINLRYLSFFFLFGSIPAILVERNSTSSLRSILLWFAIKATAIFFTYLLWNSVKALLHQRYKTKIIDLIFIGGIGGSCGGVVVHQLARYFSLENDSPIFVRTIGTFLVGALWLPSMSTANNSLQNFKKKELEVRAKLLSQDQLKFKQSKVFEFLINSFYRSIQQRLSVTALEAREILNQQLDGISPKDEIPELVTRIATLNFRNLSHSIQNETNFTTNLGDSAENLSFWKRRRKLLSFATLFKFNPVLDPFPYSLLISIFCAGYISRNATFSVTIINVSLIFICNFAILKVHTLLAQRITFDSKALTFSAVLSTSIIPALILSTLDRLQFLGLRFQGSNFYFFSYFVLALILSFLGYVGLLIKLTFQEMEDSLQNQFREGVDKEKIVTTEIVRITVLFARHIHGNLQSSLVSLSSNLKLAVRNGESEKSQEIIDQILTILHNPELHLDRDVADLHTEVLKKCSLWDGLVDIHPEILVGEHQFSPQVINQVMDCVEEMISNAVRHGKASAIRILIQGTSDARLVLTCTDNGIYDESAKAGLGFKIYQEASNGDWTISRVPEENLTTVQILISS